MCPHSREHRSPSTTSTHPNVLPQRHTHMSTHSREHHSPSTTGGQGDVPPSPHSHRALCCREEWENSVERPIEERRVDSRERDVPTVVSHEGHVCDGGIRSTTNRRSEIGRASCRQ